MVLGGGTAVIVDDTKRAEEVYRRWRRTSLDVMGRSSWAGWTLEDAVFVSSLAAAMMLDWLGQTRGSEACSEGAELLERAVEQTIDHVLDELLATDAQILLFNGGTGIAPRDNTFDALFHVDVIF